MLHSNNQESLTKCVTELLEGDTTNVEGKQELIDWQAQQGNTEVAFTAALQIKEETIRAKQTLLFLL